MLRQIKGQVQSCGTAGDAQADEQTNQSQHVRLKPRLRPFKVLILLSLSHRNTIAAAQPPAQRLRALRFRMGPR